MRVFVTALLGVVLLVMAVVLALDERRARTSISGRALLGGKHADSHSSGREAGVSSKPQRISQMANSEQLIRRADLLSRAGSHEAAISVAKLALERAPECENAREMVQQVHLRRAVGLASVESSQGEANWSRIIDKALSQAGGLDGRLQGLEPLENESFEESGSE